MTISDSELVFFVSSSIMLLLFIIIYQKLVRNPEISIVHKVVYGIIFPSIVIFGYVSIFIYQLFMSWREVLMFNIVWIPFFLLMLQDLVGDPHARKIHFGYLFLAVGLMILVLIGGIIVLIDLVWFFSEGTWAIPLPTFIIFALLIPPSLIFMARAYGKGEEEFTDGTITSGGRTALAIIGLTFGLILIIFGLYPFLSEPLMGEESWLPPHIGIPMLIIGIILLIPSLFIAERERRKRKDPYRYY